MYEPSGGKVLFELGEVTLYQTLRNSEYRVRIHGSETTRDKLRGRKGNSPDRRLRPPITTELLRS
jgi:hypothetical protein